MAVLVYASFTGADGVDVSAYTPDISAGSGFSDSGANQTEIIGNQVKFSASATGFWIDSGVTDHYVHTTFNAGGADNRVSVHARRDNATVLSRTCYEVNFRFGINEIYIFKQVGGVSTQLGATISMVIGQSTTYKLGIRVTGTTIEALIDDVVIGTRTDSSITTGTSGGVAHFQWLSAAARADNFYIESIGGAPTLITASDAISASLGDSSTSLRLSTLADNLTCSITDVVGSISVVLSAADAVAAAIVDASTAQVNLALSDTVSAAIAELASGFGTVTASDALGLSVAESINLLCALAASDSVSLSTAEGLVAIASVVQVSDALGVSIADATVAVLALLARGDSLDMAVAEAIMVLGTLNRSDALDLSVSDQSQLAVLLQALDTLSVTAVDEATRQAIGQVVARLSAKLSIYPTLSGKPKVNDE